MNQSIYKSYAEVIIKTGVNVQKGQPVIINAPIEAVELVREVTKLAYEAGAKYVKVNYKDDLTNKMRYLYSEDQYLEEYPAWEGDLMEAAGRDFVCLISIVAPNPDLMADVDPIKNAKVAKSSALGTQKFRTIVGEGGVSWLVVAYPCETWAKKMYPDQDVNESLKVLWEDVIKIMRLDTPDPNQAWSDHSKNLQTRVDYLNKLNIASLRYTSPGTDLTVTLPEDHLWEGGASENTENQAMFMANIPTEEVFTAPHRLGVNGTLKSTMPLNYNGSLIDGFSFVFKDGKVVDFAAETGYEVLKNMIETDDGAPYLGEVALVPVTSPIYQTGKVFCNTLFDENASCHFALGRAYASSIKGGELLSPKELEEKGGNFSLIHVDFMVGSEELSIEATCKDGKKVQIFTNGNWA